MSNVNVIGNLPSFAIGPHRFAISGAKNEFVCPESLADDQYALVTVGKTPHVQVEAVGQDEVQALQREGGMHFVSNLPIAIQGSQRFHTQSYFYDDGQSYVLSLGPNHSVSFSSETRIQKARQRFNTSVPEIRTQLTMPTSDEVYEWWRKSGFSGVNGFEGVFEDDIAYRVKEKIVAALHLLRWNRREKSFVDFLKLYHKMLKEDPQLFRLAVNVCARAFYFSDNISYGRDFSYINTFELLCLLLDIPFHVASDFLEKTFLTMPCGKREGFESFLRSCLNRSTDLSHIRCVDVGTAKSLMPLYMHHLLSRLYPDAQLQCVGIEKEDGFAGMPPEQREGLENLGVSFVTNHDLIDSDMPVAYAQTASLPAGPYDVVTWMRPYIFDDRYELSNQRIVYQAVNQLKDHGCLIISIVTKGEHVKFMEFLNMILSVLDQQDRPYRIQMKELVHDLKKQEANQMVLEYADSGAVFDKKQSHIYDKMLVIEFGVKGDPVTQGFMRQTHSSRNDVFCQAATHELQGAKGLRAELLERAIAIVNRDERVVGDRQLSFKFG